MTAESRCDRVLAAGEDLATVLAEVADGAVVGLPAGHWPGPLKLTRSVTLMALGPAHEVVIDAERHGPVVTVAEDGLVIRLLGLSLVNGFAETGAGVSLDGFSEVHLEVCLLRGSRAGQGPGGACHAQAGKLSLSRCGVFDNQARGGTAFWADGVCAMELRDCLVLAQSVAGGASIQVRDGAEVELTGCTIIAGEGPALAVLGSSSRRPRLTVQGSILIGTPSLDLDATYGGRVFVGDSLLSSAASGVYKPTGAVVVDDEPQLLRDGQQQFRPGPSSPARGLVKEGGGVDLNGQTRPATGATAGAFE